MKIITDSTTLVATPDWSILNNMPIQFTVDATEKEIEIVLPSISTIVSGVTLITFQVIGDNSVTILPTDDNSIDFLNTSILLEKEKLYEFSIANETSWAVSIVPNSSSTGKFIPLSGTEVGSPVTGDIEVDAYNLGSFRIIGTKIDENPYAIFSMSDGGNIGMFSEAYDSDTDTTIILSDVVKGNEGLQVRKNDSETYFSTPYKGFYSDEYHGANYDDNTYVQKKYVDNAMIPIDYGDIENVGGIENVQVYTTGSGTGIASVDLSPIMAIGKDVTVSDLGNNCSTHNIQIDSGLGNTILYNGVASQDITLNTDGASVTIRRMTANKFMVIAKN